MLVRIVALFLSCQLALLLTQVGHAFAQEQRSPSILEFFGLKPAKPKVRVKKPKSKLAAPSKSGAKKSATKAKASTSAGSAQKRQAAGDAVSGEQIAPEKRADAKRVLVIGDFMADGISEGLARAFEAEAGVVVVSKPNGSSGFVRDDYFNWPQETGAIIAEARPQAIVVMIGTNDRQQMSVNGVREAILSPNWTAEYEKRVSAFAMVLKSSGLPVVWIGMPPFKQTSMTSDMLSLNDIYRRNAESIPGKYIDIWDGFLDEQGAFSINGFDHIGQPARLRASDGINLTIAGKRKIAFYAEKPLREALGTLGIENAVPFAYGFDPFLLPGPRKPAAKDLAAVTRTQPISLFDPAFDGASELLGGQTSAVPLSVQTPAQALYVDGIPPAPVPGRIDQTNTGMQTGG